MASTGVAHGTPGGHDQRAGQLVRVIIRADRDTQDLSFTFVRIDLGTGLQHRAQPLDIDVVQQAFQ